MSIREAAHVAWFIDTFNRMEKRLEECQRELEQSQTRTLLKLEAMPLPTTHIPMPVNPVSQTDEE